jgi:hypothetical protein
MGKITKAASVLSHSTHGSTAQVHEQNKQIDALKKQLAHKEESFMQTASDGGGANLTSAMNTAKQSITDAINTMKTSVTSGFTSAKADVVALEDMIDTAEKTIPTTELEAVKVEATEWCASKTALDTAISEHTTAVTALNNAKSPNLDSSLLAMSNFGPVTTCDLSVGESEACSTSWECDLAQTVKNAISAARTTYHTAIWNKKNKEESKATAEETNTGKQSSFLTRVDTTVDAQTAHCTGNDGIHASAVNAFNGVNAGRASMYRQLSIVQCLVNHLDVSDTSPVAVPEAATQGATSTSTDDCVSKIKTEDQIRSDRFPDEALSGHASTCPTRAAYMNQIKAYGHPDMNLSDEWTPGATTCDNVANHGGSSSAFLYAPNGVSCSTECGQDASDIVKYNCAKFGGAIVDIANCAGLTLPTDYSEHCAATASCTLPPIPDPTWCDGDIGNDKDVATKWATRTPAGCDAMKGALNCCTNIPDDLTELSFPGLVTVEWAVHFYMGNDKITKIDLPDLRKTRALMIQNFPSVTEVSAPVVSELTRTTAPTDFFGMTSLTDQSFLSSMCAMPVAKNTPGFLGKMQSPSEPRYADEHLECP